MYSEVECRSVVSPAQSESVKPTIGLARSSGVAEGVKVRDCFTVRLRYLRTCLAIPRWCGCGLAVCFERTEIA